MRDTQVTLPAPFRALVTPGWVGVDDHRQNGAVPVKVKVLLVALVAAMVALSVYAYRNGVTGESASPAVRPSYVDKLIPPPDSEALKQDEVGLELAEGYDAYLIIDGVAIQAPATEDRPDGLRRNTAVRGVYYDPAPGRSVAELATPRACVMAMIYRSVEGPTKAEPFQWCFDTT